MKETKDHSLKNIVFGRGLAEFLNFFGKNYSLLSLFC
ncbi:BH2106 [Halalkalibacterium halodurans C-125]|jgi:hypothetical protein|uniref:BH2106 protein n=1 Tax=Halalkalibacterium halodurans (strain ATCC BAA-125 / DSM 18197 / FERM 7344 / JCM 9153 / C-125) TaxID=272558 RepID=Q9KB29_HALH5|nr:BH2106 [Halalkalibacterium halodurans C-125]